LSKLPQSGTLNESADNELDRVSPEAVEGQVVQLLQNRKDGSVIASSARLKLKNLVHSLGAADYSWKRMFSTVDPNYAEMNREDIIDRVFSTSNRDDLAAALETVKNMYGSRWSDPSLVQKFQQVCNAFGIGYDELL